MQEKLAEHEANYAKSIQLNRIRDVNFTPLHL